MNKELFEIEGRSCTAYFDQDAACLLLQPADDHDLDILDHQIEILSNLTKTPFLLISFRITDWNVELSPWSAPPVFGRESFGDGAADTLHFFRNKLIPLTHQRYRLKDGIPYILGGYSLAGLFSLWSAYQTDIFAGIAAVSPSVWFPGWIKYAQSLRPAAKYIYLSLGDREEKTKNQVMATVGNCIRTQLELLTACGIANDFESNEGNHFRDPDLRCAKGFAHCIKALL